MLACRDLAASFCCSRRDPFECFCQILLGVGIRQPQMAFAVLTEGGSGESGDAVILQEHVGKWSCFSSPAR